MKIDFRFDDDFDDKLLDSISGAIRNVWASAAQEYYAKHIAATAHNLKPPQGIQSLINSNLDKSLLSHDWQGKDGRFVKGSTWLRITFRHQMSLGSDFMDGLLLAKREGIQAAIIAAPSLDFARLVTPRDAGAIVTYHKLEEYFSRARSLFPIPLILGRLSGTEGLSQEVDRLIRGRE